MAGTPVGPTNGGKVYAFNNLTTSPVQVVPANVSRIGITFHNPGVAVIYFAPVLVQTTGSNASLTPSINALGGCFLLNPGDTYTITGECTGAWQAFSASGSSNPLTVMESNV